MGKVLNKEGHATFGWIVTVPQGEVYGSRNGLLCSNVFDSAELFNLSDDGVIGQDTSLVLSLGAVGNQPVLVQRHHHIGTVFVHLRPQ
ncbi:hypothetical protein TB1_029345 [Malus domestica]